MFYQSIFSDKIQLFENLQISSFGNYASNNHSRHEIYASNFCTSQQLPRFQKKNIPEVLPAYLFLVWAVLDGVLWWQSAACGSQTAPSRGKSHRDWKETETLGYVINSFEKGRYLISILRDHFVYAPNQWETTLQYNVVSHWLGTCTKWSLNTPC